MSDAALLSRRTLLQRVVQAFGGLVAWRSIGSAGAEESARNESGPLTVRVMRPYDAETPVQEFTSFLTPAHRLFVRSHAGDLLSPGL